MEDILSILGELARESSTFVVIGLRNRDSVIKYFSERFGEPVIKAIELFRIDHDANGWLVQTKTRFIFYVNQDMNKFKEYDLIKWVVDDLSNNKFSLREISENQIELFPGKNILFNPQLISKNRILDEIETPVKGKLLSQLNNDEKKELIKIYIGQESNHRGILYKFKDQIQVEKENALIIQALVSYGLVKEICPYSIKSIKTLITSVDGTLYGQELISEKLNLDSLLIDDLKIIPKKILSFFIFHADLGVGLEKENFLISDWEDFLIGNHKIFDYLLKFWKILEKRDLAVLVNDYASSKGGRIDPKKYVISSEVLGYIMNKFSLSPLEKNEFNKAIVLYCLWKIKDEILPIKDLDLRRNAFWNFLQVLPFDESLIKYFVDKFSKEGITSEYHGITEETFLFSLNDESKFDVKLNNLVDEFVVELSEETIDMSFKELDAIVFTSGQDLLKIHSDLFAILGNFEIKIRNYILNEMKVVSQKESWYESLKDIKLVGEELPYQTIYDKLQFRKNEDLKDRAAPEDELIYYADIIDYKNIIFKRWEIFGNKLLKRDISKEILEHGFNEINRIRKKIMHLRSITQREADTLRLFILPRLERIFKN